MSLEQPQEDLRFIFPVLSFIRVWDKGSTSHIYNEPLSLLSVLWFSLRYRILCDDEQSKAWSEMAARYLMMTMMTMMTLHPIRVTICPWQLTKVRPVLRYPCSALSPLRTILTEGSVYSVFPGKCPQVAPPGAPPPSDHLWCVSPLASSEPRNWRIPAPALFWKEPVTRQWSIQG